MKLYLGNLLHDLQHATRAARPALLRRFLDGMLAPDNAIPARYEEARPRLMPVVRRRGDIGVVALSTQDASDDPAKRFCPATKPLVGDLVVALVCDQPTSMAYVNEHELPQVASHLRPGAGRRARQPARAARARRLAATGPGRVVGRMGRRLRQLAHPAARPDPPRRRARPGRRGAVPQRADAHQRRQRGGHRADGQGHRRAPGGHPALAVVPAAAPGQHRVGAPRPAGGRRRLAPAQPAQRGRRATRARRNCSTRSTPGAASTSSWRLTRCSSATTSAL